MIKYYKPPKTAPKISNEAYKRQLKAARSRISGQIFEEQIQKSLAWHEERGIMKAAKTPEPMKPIGKPLGSGHFEAVYTKAAQVDFSGTIRGGRAVRFEAKQTDTGRFQRTRLTEEQMDDLRAHEKLGALCFVILAFGFDHFYRVPWRLWDGMKETFGRCYVTEADLQQHRIPFAAGVIKILHGIIQPEITERGYVPDVCVICGTYAGEGSHICPICRAKYEKEGIQ